MFGLRFTDGGKVNPQSLGVKVGGGFADFSRGLQLPFAGESRCWNQKIGFGEAIEPGQKSVADKIK